MYLLQTCLKSAVFSNHQDVMLIICQLYPRCTKHVTVSQSCQDRGLSCLGIAGCSQVKLIAPTCPVNLVLILINCIVYSVLS